MACAGTIGADRRPQQDTPNPSKAPWYFVGLQELLVYFDPWIAGVVLPGLILGGLMAIPYIDKNTHGIGEYNYKDRKFAVWVFSLGNGVLVSPDHHWVFLSRPQLAVVLALGKLGNPQGIPCRYP